MRGLERMDTDPRPLSSDLDGVPLCRCLGPALPTDHARLAQELGRMQGSEKEGGALAGPAAELPAGR